MTAVITTWILHGLVLTLLLIYLGKVVFRDVFYDEEGNLRPWVGKCVGRTVHAVLAILVFLIPLSFTFKLHTSALKDYEAQSYLEWVVAARDDETIVYIDTDGKLQSIYAQPKEYRTVVIFTNDPKDYAHPSQNYETVSKLNDWGIGRLVLTEYQFRY